MNGSSIRAWSHRRMGKAEPTVDSLAGEFFNTEGVKTRSGALVRESGQNTQDAWERDTGQPPRLEITFRTLSPVKEDPSLQAWFAGLWPHIEAPDSGLISPPSPGEPLRIALVEDFNTVGLRGDVAAEDTLPGSGNDFCQFYRIFGRSGKGDKKKGSWGIGRTVFPASSRAHAMLAYSVRNETPSGVLMGLSILKTHRLDNDRCFPYGYFGEHDSDGFCLPVTDRESLDRFAATFGLRRKAEPGLSVVIPWLDEEINPDDTIDAVLREYAIPVLQGRLVVVIRSEQGTVEIDTTTLDRLLAARSDQVGPDVLPMIQLARRGLTAPDAERVRLRDCTSHKPPVWDQSLFAEQDLASARDRYLRGEPVLIRVPAMVKPKDKEPGASTFDVFLQRDPTVHTVRPMFIREGLLISRVDARNPRGVRAIVNADGGSLADLLRAAENPSHTEWKENGENFRGKFEYGPMWLRFVRNSIDRLALILAGDAEQEDKEAFKDEFSLPSDDPGTQRHRRRKKKTVVPTPPPDPNPPQDRSAALEAAKVAGGFVIRRGNRSKPCPRRFAFQAAYAVRNGNPFDQWRKPDFQLNEGDVLVAVRNCELESCEGNRAVVRVLDEDFELFATGFGTDRDVAVRVSALEVPDEAVV